MFIKYSGTNVHAIPYVKMKSVTLKNKKTGKTRTEQRPTDLAPQDIKSLRPGWNNFPKDVWEQNKNNPGIVEMLEEGKIVLMAEEIEIVQGKKKIKKIVGMDDEEVSIKYFSESKAIAVVKDTLNRDILQRWLDEETRHKVKRALEKQIKPFLNIPQKDDE